MLKLKRLQILGFKSFCDRTELKFHGEGIAAIVGPNGCGKSNISDSISWVLGEQSARLLRGLRMEDVIFAGTRERKPTGMAEVSLTLIDPQVYEGAVSGETEIDIRDEMPEDDWDEASARTASAEATDAAVAEVQPGPPDGEQGEPPAEAETQSEAEPALEPGTEAAAISTDADAQSADGSASADSQSPEPATGGGGNPVVLKIRRRKFKSLPTAKGEIVVTRRLFRTGESEYLLNGRLCRLRDIQDIFMGTGLGPESYAIIEQGRIGQILSSKPHDRRAIIEEAAGITKFKTKKRLAEARLEQSRINLARINDIFDEVTRQMNSLKRQASKAERYVRLRDEMKAKLRVVLASRFAQMMGEEAALNASLEAASEEIHGKSTAIGTKELEQSERMHRGYAIENEMTQNQQAVNAIALEMERAVSRRATNEERCAELDARSAAARAELEREQSHLQSLQTELQSNREFVEGAAIEAAASQHEFQARQNDAQAAGTALAESERRQEARRQELMELMSSAAQIRNQITQTESHLTALDREGGRLEREIAAARVDIDNFGGKRGQIAFEFESISQRTSALAARIAETRAQMEAKRKAEEEAKHHLDGLRAEFASALGRKNSLETVINEHGYSTESVKRLFQSSSTGNGFAPAGVLADFLEVENRYESVVEDFLRDELNYVVVKSWDSADEGMRLLQSDVDGRATFLVHPDDAQAKFSFAVNDPPPPASQPEQLVSLKNCIRVLNGFGRSLEVILPKLRDGYIAPDAQVARNLALQNPDAYFLSASGECFHNVTVTGGKQRKEGPLSLKRELRDVIRIIADLETSIQNEQHKIQTLGRELAELGKLLRNLEEEHRESEKQVLTSGHALKQLETELVRSEQRLNTYLLELDRMKAEREVNEAVVAEKRDQVQAIELQRLMLEANILSAQEQLASLRTVRDATAQAVAEAGAKLAGLEERRRSATAALQRVESLFAESEQRVESLQAQIQSAMAEKCQREIENLQIAERLSALEAEKVSAEAIARELQHESEQVRARIAEIEQELKALRAELDVTREQKAELGRQLAKLQSDVAHMAETCLNELNVSADQLRADLQIALLTGEPLAAEEAAYREIRAKLENMGPVNMMALEEYKETAQRHEFLEVQRKDLLESIENTQATIKEIDEFSRQKFQEAFDRINENFQFTFRKLFGGGQAFMRLTDELNTAESGIDVVASPPGKKLQNVLLLSGGEKALAALALLVGIFQYQPSPFCILDEVDAPLDEANIGRFTDLIKDMAVQTQFIIITHSKKTMGVAPVMYGVTMQEPGVSKVVSVRFGQIDDEARVIHAATA